MTGGAIMADTLAEGRRLVELLNASSVRGRLLGGAGIALHGHGALPDVLQRPYGDLDFVVRRSDGATFRQLLARTGYEPNQRFNALHGHRRLLYYDAANGRQVDAFIGDFRMCHALDLDARVPERGYSIAPVDLLLTKLQIVEVNDKDLLDVLALLLDHRVGEEDDETIDRRRLAMVLGGDWGWHTTVTDNLVRLAERLARTAELADETRHALQLSINALLDVARTAPRSVRWRARARLGRRMPWYELPEEVGR